MCRQCVPLEHKNCPVDSVDNACKGVPSSEIDALYDNVGDFKTSLSSVVAKTDLNITELGKQIIDMLKEAEDLKEKSIAKIVKLCEEITSEAQSMFQTHTSNLSRGKNDLNHVIENLEGTLDDIDKMKGNTIDTKVFLKVQDILKDVERCKSDVERLRPSVMNVKMSFISDKKIEDFLLASFKMGLISLDTSQPQVAISVPEISFPMSPARSLPVTHDPSDRMPRQIARKTIPLSQITARKLDSYNVKLNDEEKSDCLITGIAITNNGRRLLADGDNDEIKMFSRDMPTLRSLSLSSTPWDIAVTGDREAVVSCWIETKLLILDISDRKINIKGTVELPFTVRGLAPYEDKLLVTTLPTPSSPSVALLDQSGTVYWSTHTDQQGQQLFYEPEYVTCSNGGGSAAVIVSDYGNETLTVLNADTGDVITRRQVKGKGPRGVTTDTAGNIYVCYWQTDEVAVLTKDLSQENVLLFNIDGLSRGPQAIVYNAVDNQLLVSNTSDDSRNTVDCFKL